MHRFFSAYKKLHNKKNDIEIKQHDFFRESFFNYINQLAKALFSPNFLIIFLSATIGFYKTGYIKFITNIVIFLYTIFYRSIHMSGGALLSSISEMPSKLIAKTFNTITNYYIQILATLSIYFSGLLYLHFEKVTIPQQSDYFSMYAIIIMFCFISFLEYGTLTYETLFITQKQGKLLAKINSINIIGVLLCIGLSFFYPTSLFLVALGIIKIGTTGYIMLGAYHIWKTSISVDLNVMNLLVHASIVLIAISYLL